VFSLPLILLGRVVHDVSPMLYSDKLLLEFKLPVMAEFWLRKACQLANSKDEEAAILFQKVRVQRLYGPLTQEVFKYLYGL
jgi:hypothetical protein